MRRAIVISFFLTLLSACVSDHAYRNGMPGTSTASVELTKADQNYVLAHVEFDDQGWFHDIRQRKMLFDKLQSIRAEQKAMLIVTYTHGWKHSAADDDENLRDFRKLLRQLDAVEQTAKRPNGPRTVVGIYIGWRGASIRIPVIENLTFWARKNAAERVGSRSVKQLFVELNQFRVIANGWQNADEIAEAHETQLIFVGHSFGGLITYQALYSEILERGLQVSRYGYYRMAKSFGDFVLLVNPAFEGAAYEPIWQAARLRGCYSWKQKPVMAIITSSADRATRYAFPAGRLYTYFQSAKLPGERDTVMHTVGHLERYRTHRLEPIATTYVEPQPMSTETSQSSSTSQHSRQKNISIGEFQLVKTETIAPDRMPYLVIQAGPELISNHNDFWNDRFRRFTVDFIVSQILAPTPIPLQPVDGIDMSDEKCLAYARKSLEILQ